MKSFSLKKKQFLDTIGSARIKRGQTEVLSVIGT